MSELHRWVVGCTNAAAVVADETVQTLWGGYGELRRLRLVGNGAPASVILKRVEPPARAEGASDRRKRRSYEVERCWYRSAAARCPTESRIARCLGQQGPLLLLEDLAASGFLAGRQRLDAAACLRWLAHFHAAFLGEPADGLWEQGSYWHLATRRDEWQAMAAGPLRQHAAELDRRLRAARWQTLLHGDAKPANFLWSAAGQAAAVDFQYVGPGCGIRDVAYLLDCCSRGGDEESLVPWSLDLYFDELRRARGHDCAELELEWRALFPVAWCDYARFLEGWGAPTRRSRFLEEMLRQAIS